MCQAMSMLITKRNKVYWKAGVDSHDTLHFMFVKKDKDLKDDKDAPNNTFARIEIKPENGDYLKPDKWIYTIDERVKPNFLNANHKKLAWKAWKEWKKEVYTFNVKEALKPIHPFLLTPPKKITQKHLEALKEWASVWASVRASVRASVWDSVRASVWDSVGDSVWDSVWASVGNSVGNSVGDSVGDSVGNSVWDSVGNSVWDSVWDSVWAYIGSLFPNIKKWKYVNNRKSSFQKIKGYPFQSAVKLWKMGLVPSYDGKIWRLHGNKKAKILWEGKL